MESVVYPDPRVVEVTPTTVMAGRITPVYIRFDKPIVTRILSCKFNGRKLGAMLFKNSTTGICEVQPVLSAVGGGIGSSGIVTVSAINSERDFNGTNIDGTAGSTLGVIDEPPIGDITSNTSAVLEYTPAYVLVTSASCALPSGGVDCIVSEKSQGALMYAPTHYDYNNGCTAVCPVTPSSQSDLVTLTLCPASGLSGTPSADRVKCHHPLHDQTLNAIKSVVILAVKPSSGSVQGGNKLTVYGAGFSNDGSLECIFYPEWATEHSYDEGGDTLTRTTTSVFVKSSRQVVCDNVPSGAPGRYRVGLRRRGVIIGMGASGLTYEYLPFLAHFNTSTTTLSSLGNTTVELTTRSDR